MKKTVVGGLALALLVSMSGPALAQEKKMTRDEYVAQMAELTKREATAQGQIVALNTQIADLNGKLDNCDMAVADLNDQIRTLADATDDEIMAFGQRLDAIVGQLEGLLALPPEVLIQRRGEVKAIEAEISDMQMSKIAALPEMAMKIDEIGKLLGQLKARIAQPITVDYMVERGDNLWNIAKKETVYDDPYMWPR